MLVDIWTPYSCTQGKCLQTVGVAALAGEKNGVVGIGGVCRGRWEDRERPEALSQLLF